MAVAALNEYEDALMEYETTVAIIQKTVDTNGLNARLVKNQIKDTTMSWPLLMTPSLFLEPIWMTIPSISAVNFGALESSTSSSTLKTSSELKSRLRYVQV